MSPAQRLRALAKRTALDGIAEELVAIAAELDQRPATPAPVGEVLSYKPLEHTAVIKWYPALNGVPPAGFNVGTKLFTRPAPGVPAEVRAALEFYASGNHFVRADAAAWETVSGEPPNFWEDEANTATIEDGTIARSALATLAAQAKQ